MSMTFSQIIARIDRCCGTTSTTYPTADKCVDINRYLGEIFAIALKSKNWNADDVNHSKDPFIATDLVANQRGYYFVNDEQSNLILAINKVMVKNQSGVFVPIVPVNQQLDGDTDSFWDGQNTAGTPTRYDKTGNGIFLDPPPSYASTGGLKLFIDREPSYFVAGDTTKVAGVDGLCHDLLYIGPSYEYCRDHGKKNTEQLYRDLQVSIQKIKDRYGNKEKDVKRRITAFYQNNK